MLPGPGTARRAGYRQGFSGRLLSLVGIFVQRINHISVCSCPAATCRKKPPTLRCFHLASPQFKLISLCEHLLSQIAALLLCHHRLGSGPASPTLQPEASLINTNLITPSSAKQPSMMRHTYSRITRCSNPAACEIPQDQRYAFKGCGRGHHSNVQKGEEATAGERPPHNSPLLTCKMVQTLSLAFVTDRLRGGPAP